MPPPAPATAPAEPPAEAPEPAPAAAAAAEPGTTNEDKKEKKKDKKKKVRKRCGHCEACLRYDCGVCTECVRKKKFGGDGASKQACIKRRCLVLTELKKERKRHRAAGIPVDLTDDDDSLRPTKRRRTKRQAQDESATATEKDPIVLQLEAAYPNPPGSLLADKQLQLPGTIGATPKPPPPPSHLDKFKYGMPLPPIVTEMCAGCKSTNAPVHQDDPDREVVILLCDGPDCPHEYHLECCIPPISEIPDGAYYCVDCDPTGASKVLAKYLDKNNDHRHRELQSSGTNPFNFLFSLWKQDLEENQGNWTDEKEDLDTATGSEQGASYHRVPKSELSRILEIQEHLQEGWQAGKAYTLDELGKLFVGKPIRLYNPLDDNYHSGRIIDYRPLPPNLHQMPPKKTSKYSPLSPSAKCHPNDDFFVNKCEFLVRFVPGTDEYRKTLVTRWIRLEEHSLAVGTHLAWGKFEGGAHQKGNVTVHPGAPSVAAPTWTPSLLFLRTSRELMPVLHLLQESEGEITYHPPGLFPKDRRRLPANHPCAAPLAKMDPKNVWALAKRLGASDVESSGDGTAASYKLLRVLDETRDLWSRKPTASHVDQLKFAMAIAECREQEACQRWRNLPLKNKYHPKALQGRDEFAVGPVAFENRPPAKEEEELCPLVRPPGLDRGHLMERLLKRGTIHEATRDAAVGLECWLIP